MAVPDKPGHDELVGQGLPQTIVRFAQAPPTGNQWGRRNRLNERDRGQDQIRRDKAVAMTADAGREAAVQGYVARCLKQFGGLDGIYANAGISGGMVPPT